MTTTSTEALPSEVEAEQQVVGACLIDPALVAELSNKVGPRDFVDPCHRAAVGVLIAMHRAGTPIDPLTFKHALAKRPEFAGDSSPVTYMDETGVAVTTIAHFSHHLGQVVEASKKRQLFELTDHARQATLNGQSSDEVLADLWAGIEDFRRDRIASKDRFQSYPLCEFSKQDHRVEYLIENCMTAGQPGIISARSKSLKTTLACDAALSIATGTPFLGVHEVPEARNVGFISAESGPGTLVETFRRICRAKGIDIRDVSNLHVSTSMPLLTTPLGRDAIERFIEDNELACLFIDPTYKALPGVDDTQLSKMSEHLFPLSDIIDRTGCSIVLVHHNKKTPRQNGKYYDEPSMEDINGTGYMQWARFFLLLNRRREWNPETGQHWLWMRTEGSAGFGSRKWLNVSEGKRSDPGGRVWEVELLDPSEVAESERQDRQAEKESKQLEKDRKVVRELLAKHSDGLCQSKAMKEAKISARRWPFVLAAMFDEGEIEETEVTVSNQKTRRKGFKLATAEAA